MKKLITYILLLTFAFSFTACADSNQPVTDIEALKEQVFVDYIEEFYPGTYPHQRPSGIEDLYYLGTDNGYRIVMFTMSGAFLPAQELFNIAGYKFEVSSSGWKLMAYKNGKFTDLRIAYRDGLVSKEAIAKAAELHAERKNATE